MVVVAAAAAVTFAAAANFVVTANFFFTGDSSEGLSKQSKLEQDRFINNVITRLGTA